uniref:Kinesin motor domain-containing protein n=1 Tax=Anopheles dirus TaxID=7168 RepID=A0A182NJ19_9DIPT
MVRYLCGKAMSDNVKVSIKVRPLIKREKDSKLTPQWRIRDNTIISCDGNGDPFVFDHIFDETVSTRQLFDTVCRPIILSALNGINGTIFAYGQTSSGKTYTMIGNDREPGVVPLTAREIFEQIKKIKERQFLIRVGFIEIYNEKVHDLLNTANTNLKIVENQCGDVSVNSKECITNCAEQIIQHVDEGNKARKIGETNMNERSSRSHTIFRITIESRTIGPTSGDGGMDKEAAVQIGILNLVDLAGSERADQTGATGSRFKEGVCINKSLLSLSCVIQKLSENSDKQFINYRDSKLTRILQASLGGNAVTSMICNITPAVVDETYYTLSFAMRAKNIRNKPKVNEILTDAAMMKRLEREIKRLQSELRSEQNKNSKIKTMELQNAITLRTNQFINSNQAQLAVMDNSRRRTWCPSSTEIPRLAQLPTPNVMGPPAPYTVGHHHHQQQQQYLVTMNNMTPQIAIRTISPDGDVTPNGENGGGFSATLALIGSDGADGFDDDDNDIAQINYRDLLDHQERLARKMRSSSPNGGVLNPFATYGDEFVPGEQISFGRTSVSPLTVMARDLHTPKALTRKRRSSTGDSPTQCDYQQRCRELEQELVELQEFTKLETTVEVEHLRQELANREAALSDLKNDLDERHQRMEQLEERCTHLEIELKGQMATATQAENERALAVKERQVAVREAELHRNQHTGIECEYELFRQRSEAREKELIESLQEARSGGAAGNNSSSSDSFKLDQKREEMKRLEMQNYEFTLQLEECNKQIDHLKASCLEQHRKLEQVKQTVLECPPHAAKGDDASTRSLLYSLRKLLLPPEETSAGAENDTVATIASQHNGFHSPPSPSVHDADQTYGAIDANVTILGEQRTIQELLTIVAQLEANILVLEQEKGSHQEANDAKLNELRTTLEGTHTAAINQLEQQLKQWREKFEVQTSEYDEMSMQLMDQMQDYEVLRKEYETFKQGVEAKRAELEQETVTLRESLEKESSERAQLERLCRTLREEHSGTSKATEAERSELVAAFEAEKERLAQECKELKIRLDEAISKREAIVQELQQLKERKNVEENVEMEKLKQDLAEQQTGHVQLQEQFELLRREQATARDKQLQQHSEELERLQTRITQLEETHATCEQRLENLQTEREEVQNTNDKLRTQVDELKVSLDQQAQLEQDCTEKQSLLDELTRLRESHANHQSRIDDLEQEANKHRAEIASIIDREAKARESSQNLLDQLTKSESSVRDELLAARQANNTAEKRILELEHEAEKYRTEIASMVDREASERESSENLLDQLTKSESNAREELLVARQTHESLQKRIHELEQELVKTNEEALSQRNGDREQQEVFVKGLQQCKHTLETQLNEKSNELSKITAELEGCRNECDKMMAQNKTEQESYDIARLKLEGEIELLKKMVDQVSEDKASLEKDHSECSTRQQSLQRQLEERDGELLKYITDLDSIRAEQLRLVEQQNESQRALQQKNTSLEQELESLQQNMLQLMSENESLLKDQLDGEQSHRERVSADGEELEKLRSCRDESERLMVQLERDLATVRAELEMVRTELLDEKRRHDERTEAIKRETDRLQDAIHALEDEKRRLLEAEDRLRGELNAREMQTAELEANQRDKESALDELRRENNDLTVAVQELSAKIVNLEEQMDGNEASQRKTIDMLVRERHEQEQAAATLKHQLNLAEEKLREIEKTHTQLEDELRAVKAALEASVTARTRLEQDIEESSSVRDVLERELRDLKNDLEHLDTKLANERYEQERQVSANLRRELDEKQKELESFMATGRPSLGDGRVVQALRRENEDLFKQLTDAQHQIDSLKGRQLQERVEELERLESEIARLRDEMSTMRHESSFNEKVDEITHLQQKVQDVEKHREETVHQKRTLERAFDQLRFKHQSLAKEVEELRKTTDKERKSRRQSTHDNRRGLLFNSKEAGTMTDPTSADCACTEMNDKIKELRSKLTLKDCQLNTQKLMSSANPLKNEVAELRRKLEEQNRDRAQIEQELREVLEQLDRERKERRRHCTQCIRHTRQQNARCDKAVQAYLPSDSPAKAAVSVSILSTGGRNGTVAAAPTVASSAELADVQQRYDEQQEQYERLSKKYQTMKQLCRIRNEKIVSLSEELAEKENENTNVNRSVQKLKQQLNEADNRHAQSNRNIAHQLGGKMISKADVGLQTDGDAVREEAQMYRVKYERYKALAAKLLEETKAAKSNGQ